MKYENGKEKRARHIKEGINIKEKERNLHQVNTRSWQMYTTAFLLPEEVHQARRETVKCIKKVSSEVFPNHPAELVINLKYETQQTMYKPEAIALRLQAKLRFP